MTDWGKYGDVMLYYYSLVWGHLLISVLNCILTIHPFSITACSCTLVMVVCWSCHRPSEEGGWIPGHYMNTHRWTIWSFQFIFHVKCKLATTLYWQWRATHWINKTAHRTPKKQKDKRSTMSTHFRHESASRVICIAHICSVDIVCSCVITDGFATLL